MHFQKQKRVGSLHWLELDSQTQLLKQQLYGTEKQTCCFASEIGRSLVLTPGISYVTTTFRIVYICLDTYISVIEEYKKQGKKAQVETWLSLKYVTNWILQISKLV